MFEENDRSSNGNLPDSKVIGRRGVLAIGGTTVATAMLPGKALAYPRTYRRIATEEAFLIPELVVEYRQMLEQAGSSVNVDNRILQAVLSRPILVERLLDIGEGRINIMDEASVDMQVLSISGTGVQTSKPDRAVALATLTNDRLAEAVARHPTRFAGLATFAPQVPAMAARELERAQKLGFNGALVNSHTNNRYLDEQQFWPILEAAEALDMPIYIHPRSPSDGMAAPMRDFGMIMAAWGFGVEAGTHGMRLILSGALDRFPRLRIVLGHMGEAVHFWTARLDNFYRRAKVEWASTQRLELKPSEYLRRNFSITTSGQENPDALIYSIRTLGLENIMWAIDYPYEDSAGAVAFLENAPITGRERAAIFGENADRIFRLKSMAWRSQGV